MAPPSCSWRRARRPTRQCAAATVDAIAGGGRFIAGIGVSGPQIVEGWYGQPWGKPYWRIKDYVAIMRKIFAREAPVSHEGREISLPYKGEGAMGVGKPLKSILHCRPDIPIYLGTGNEATVKLTAEIADGWLPLGFVPGSLPEYMPWLEEGFRRAGNGKSLRNFEIQAHAHVEVNDDVKAALDKLKPEVALYVGGMGHRDKNFHKDMLIRRGFKDAAERIQELYLAGRKDEATAAVPDEWVDLKSLVGPRRRIIERYRAWEDSGITGFSVIRARSRSDRGDGRRRQGSTRYQRGFAAYVEQSIDIQVVIHSSSYRPRYTGSRFSRNEVRPSAKSGSCEHNV